MIELIPILKISFPKSISELLIQKSVVKRIILQQTYVPNSGNTRNFLVFIFKLPTLETQKFYYMYRNSMKRENYMTYLKTQFLPDSEHIISPLQRPIHIQC